MSGPRKSKLGAVLLFSLIAFTVIGGMGWATVASFRLAEKTITEERVTRLQRAVGEIEKYVTRVVNTEAARDFKEYSATYAEDPVSIRTRDGRQLNLNPSYVEVELRSPLAPTGRTGDWRPYDWIDLYFQLDSHGKLTSPQIPDDSDHVPNVATVGPRVRSTWEWLQSILPCTRLSEMLADARERDQGEFDADEGEPAQPLPAAEKADSPTDTSDSDSTPTGPRRGSLLEAQAGYIPHEQCVPERVVARNIRSGLVTPLDDDDSTFGPSTGVSVSHMAIAPPFWLDPTSDEHRKLAFVREVFADAEVLYQGFIGDWERLKPELLARIGAVFPEADLVPVADESPAENETDQVVLRQLPVVLSVPYVAGGVSAAAWRSIRGMLLISWTAALAVLIVAGWGVMNLVALTERRMQFAYAVTHELRTPLTTFRLYSDMLSAGLVSDGARQEYLDTLNRESIRLSTMVESVLEYARLENRQARLHLREIDGPSLLQIVGESLDKRCGESGIEGRKSNHVVNNGHLIRTDVDLVSQIAGVLVNNACRHARSSKKPVVALRLGGENGRVFLDVTDSGPGVDLGDARRIFKPFRRGRDADTAARGGVGLGLALARNWASLLGGRLDLIYRHDPELGGAHFRLTIPTQVWQ